MLKSKLLHLWISLVLDENILCLSSAHSLTIDSYSLYTFSFL